MGRRGWGGSPPADDEEARKRIVDAAIRLIERRGAQRTSLSDVAAFLSVTRPTVYRHFCPPRRSGCRMTPRPRSWN
jgi:AcrR family transcriptional regulator